MNRNSLIGLTLIGIVGIFVFRSFDIIPLMIMSLGISIISSILLVISLDPEWGDPFKLKKFKFKRKDTNMKIIGSNKQKAFLKVLNTINNKKIAVSIENDGIYIRLAGDENHGEAFNEKKCKVYDYEI